MIKFYVYHPRCDYLAEFNTKDKAQNDINEGLRNGFPLKDFKIITGEELKIEPVEVVKVVEITTVKELPISSDRVVT